MVLTTSVASTSVTPSASVASAAASLASGHEIQKCKERPYKGHKRKERNIFVQRPRGKKNKEKKNSKRRNRSPENGLGQACANTFPKSCIAGWTVDVARFKRSPAFLACSVFHVSMLLRFNNPLISAWATRRSWLLRGVAEEARTRGFRPRVEANLASSVLLTT